MLADVLEDVNRLWRGRFLVFGCWSVCGLLVEDNPINQMVARKLPEKHGVSVMMAGNGQTLQDACDGGSFEAILMALAYAGDGRSGGNAQDSRVRESLGAFAHYRSNGQRYG